MVRASLGRGLMVVVGIALVVLAMVVLNMPDHRTAGHAPAVAAADSTSNK